MQWKSRILTSLFAGALIAGATFALTQEGGMPQMPSAGPEHKVLAAMAGDWNAEAEMTGMGTSDATLKCELAMNDLWLIQNYEGEVMGSPFTGLGLMGYDPAKKMYVGTWVDSFTTALEPMEGTYDKDKKELTTSQNGLNPMSGETVKMKMVTTFVDRDKWTFALYMPGPGGKDMKTMTITYTRKK